MLGWGTGARWKSCSCPLLIHPCCFTPGLKCQVTVDPLVHMVNGFRLSGDYFKHMPKSTISMAQVEMTPFQAHPSPSLCIAMTSGQDVTKSQHRKQYHTQILHIHCQVRYGEEVQNVKTANQITSSSPATPKSIISIARLDMDQEGTECQNSKQTQQ
jgi:hypothetical protein